MNTSGRTRKAKARRTAVIQFHDGQPAINVKYQARIEHGADEQTAIATWDRMVEQWWKDAEIAAQELGYSGVFAEGRSGGWLVPYTQFNGAGKQTFKWKGQGPELGYPKCPDVTQPKERARFLKLQERIAELMIEVPVRFREQLEAFRNVERKDS